MAHTKIASIDKFLKKKGNTFICDTKSIKVYIPKIYVERGLAIIENVVTTLGIVKIVINNTFSATLMMVADISLQPSNVSAVKEDDYDYVVLEFVKGDVFITNRSIIKNSTTIYNIFVSFVDLGKIPPFIEYETILHLFDNDYKLCGLNFGINHSTYEVLFAHMYRDKDDPFKFYRHTRMQKKPIVASLNTISLGPVSATARTIGAYMNDGLMSSLTHDNNEPSAIENILRA